MARVALTAVASIFLVGVLGCGAGSKHTTATTLTATNSANGRAMAGYLVLRQAGDGGVDSAPFATVVVHGFVLVRVPARNEAGIDVYYLHSISPSPETTGNVSRRSVPLRNVTETAYTGSGFRLRAVGLYRLVIRGSGVYLFAGGSGSAKLGGSSVRPGSDGQYSLDGAPFRALPQRPLKRAFGKG